MEDAVHSPGSRRSIEVKGFINKKMSKKSLVASGPKTFTHKFLDQMPLLNHVKMGNGTAGHVASFLLKIVALEMVRRFSSAKCPFVWSGLQGLQILCYPPFKWIQRWDPFRVLVNAMQTLSKPLLVLSIANAFSDQPACNNVNPDSIDDSHGLSNSHAVPESNAEFPSEQSITDAGICDEVPQSLSSTNWLLRLYVELENQGISFPERVNEDELHRFYTAANGDFSCLLSSVKKTIYWRENYRILSGQELEIWSNLVFWHGFDVNHRPCLIVRLGLACTSLPCNERPRFAQAIVSQVEHGVLHLVDSENPQITVLLDCEGLSPLRFPMQMMRSCSGLLQDNFPNRLGCLFVIRLPPVVRVLAQTFIQVLKPVTRQKLYIEGNMYQKVLSEHLQTIPSYIGGICSCTSCANARICNTQPRVYGETLLETNRRDLPTLLSSCETDMDMNSNCDQVLRAAVIGILIFSVLIAFMAGIYDPESRPVLPP